MVYPHSFLPMAYKPFSWSKEVAHTEAFFSSAARGAERKGRNPASQFKEHGALFITWRPPDEGPWHFCKWPPEWQFSGGFWAPSQSLACKPSLFLMQIWILNQPEVFLTKGFFFLKPLRSSGYGCPHRNVLFFFSKISKACPCLKFLTLVQWMSARMWPRDVRGTSGLKTSPVGWFSSVPEFFVASPCDFLSAFSSTRTFSNPDMPWCKGFWAHVIFKPAQALGSTLPRTLSQPSVRVSRWRHPLQPCWVSWLWDGTGTSAGKGAAETRVWSAGEGAARGRVTWGKELGTVPRPSSDSFWVSPQFHTATEPQLNKPNNGQTWFAGLIQGGKKCHKSK